MAKTPDRKTLVIADAHLPLDSRKGSASARNSLIGLIRSQRDGLGSLVLLGDLFDFWYEWWHVVPKRAFPLMMELRSLVDSGVEVHYFAGNHDFRLAGFLRDEIGMTLHMNGWSVELNGRRYWFHHGDGLAVSDVNYRRMKKVFRSKLAQTLFGAVVHPDLAMVLGRIASEGGRQKTRTRESLWPPVSEYADAAQREINRGHDVVVIGHTHLQLDLELDSGHLHIVGPFHTERNYSLITDGLPRSGEWR